MYIYIKNGALYVKMFSKGFHLFRFFAQHLTFLFVQHILILFLDDTMKRIVPGK